MSEPISLVVSLSSLKTNEKSRKLSKNKSRSRSVPQLSNLLTVPETNQKNTSQVETLTENDDQSAKNQEAEENSNSSKSSKAVFSIELNENENIDDKSIMNELLIAANITDDEKYRQISSTNNPKKTQNNGLVMIIYRKTP